MPGHNPMRLSWSANLESAMDVAKLCGIFLNIPGPLLHSTSTLHARSHWHSCYSTHRGTPHNYFCSLSVGRADHPGSIMTTLACEWGMDVAKLCWYLLEFPGPLLHSTSTLHAMSHWHSCCSTHRGAPRSSFCSLSIGRADHP